MNPLSQEKIKKIEEQIEIQQKPVSFDMREFTVEFYVNKYLKNIEKDDNELYVPDYQREFIWDNKHQSRFIESLILGLPVPFIFAAEIKDSGRLEIVDGSQRIRTLAAFLTDELQLSHLEKLTELNNIYFSQMSASRQRMFKNIAIRMIILSSKATEEVRNEMFDRINTSSVPLLPMETRRGIYKGNFTDFIIRLAKDPRFVELCPIPKFFKNRREEEELVLRLFAFSDAYPSFKHVESKGVAKYLDEYLDTKNRNFKNSEIEQKEADFYKMISYIAQAYPSQGFAKKKGAVGISKPYFEAIAIGIYLALKENPNIKPQILSCLVVDKKNRNEFCDIVEGRYKTHTAKKIYDRITYVKKAYLNETSK